MRTTLGAVVLGVVFMEQAPAQVSDSREEDPGAAILRQRRQTYPDLSRIVDLVQSVPPELAADALLRVAGDPRNLDHGWKIGLLERAFETGALAREPNRRRVMSTRVVAKSRAEIISLGFDQRIDRLSLQSRAVREMLPLDQAKALDMFQRIVFPRLGRLTCRDALIDDVEEYFFLVGEIVESAFTAEQRQQGQHVDLLSDQVNRMNTPVEVGAVAKLLSSSRLTEGALNLLASRFAAKLEQIESDDRSFSASFGRNDEEVRRLAAVLVARNLSSDGLIAAYRRYLRTNLGGNRCIDSGGGEFTSSVRDSFNQKFASDADASRAPLTSDDPKPAKTEGQADWDPFVSGDEFERAWQEYLDLWLGKGHGPLMGKGTTALLDEQKSTIEWRTEFDDFLGKIDDIKPQTSEPEFRYFYRKATALQAALRVAPPGPERDKVIRQFVALLRSSNLQQESFLEWYAQVQRTMSAIRNLGPEASARLIDELERSGDTVLSFYALASRVICAGSK